MPHHDLNGRDSQQHHDHGILERFNEELQDRIPFLRLQFVEAMLRLLRFDGPFIEACFGAASFRKNRLQALLVCRQGSPLRLDVVRMARIPFCF
ncbi:hypothetical protein SDC9_145873 [bioreactor metagenome]|uniref:Uncharacterized protein n=1 Tax=bioreactor metagenome TaxID=1076179 RepID=A0A645EB21_9ZZZZ